MVELTFEELPKAVACIQIKLEIIERLLANSLVCPKIENDVLLTVKDAAEFLNLSVPTIYGLIHRGELPCMKRSKRVYFSRIELIEYLKVGRKKTVYDLEEVVYDFLKNKIGRTMEDSHPNDLHKRHSKDSHFQNQLQSFFDHLKVCPCTCSMAAAATGIAQKNLCRYKRQLEKAGLLWLVKKGKCKITGYWAWYITTDPDQIKNKVVQLSLF